MPILYFLKEPPLTLALRGELTRSTIKRIAKGLPVIHGQAPDGKPILVAIEKESNIAYVKEITEEQLRNMKEEQKEQKKGPRIQTPAMMMPGKKGGRKH